MTTPNSSPLRISDDQLFALEADLSSGLTIQLRDLGVDARVVAETFRVGQSEVEIRLNVTQRYALSTRAREYNVWAKGQGFALSGEFFEVPLTRGGSSLVTAVAVDHDRRCVEVEDEDETRYELPFSKLKKYGTAGQVQKQSKDPRQAKREMREIREINAMVETVSVAATQPDDSLKSPPPPSAVDLNW